MNKKTLETGQEKIQKICDVLRLETLEPAKKEAGNIISEARIEAEQIIKEAKKQSEQFLIEAKHKIEQERNVLQSSLLQASRQSLEALRQAIEHKLFNPNLHMLLERHMANPQVIADLITGLVKAIEKEGLNANIEAFIPSKVSPQEVASLLGKEILEALKNHSVTIGDFDGGAKVKLVDKQLSLEITDKEVEDILKRYVRKEFRKMLFQDEAV